MNRDTRLLLLIAANQLEADCVFDWHLCECKRCSLAVLLRRAAGDER